MIDMPDLPDFLRVDPADRTEHGYCPSWKGRKLTRQGSSFGRLDAAEQRQRTKLQREYEREQERKRKARFEEFLESRRG